MAELIENTGFEELTPEMLKTQEGVNSLNNIIKKLLRDVPSDLEGVRIFKGYGTPEASVTAGIGSLYMRLDGSAGTSTYQKQSGTGNTGWVAVPGGTGSYTLTVEEQDGSPSVASVNKIKVPNGKLTDNGSGVVSVTVGDGDVVGPSSAVDDRVVTFDGTTGKLIQDSGYAIGDVIPALTLVSVTTFTAASDTGEIAIDSTQRYKVIFDGVVNTANTRLNVSFIVATVHDGYHYLFKNNIISNFYGGGNTTSVGLPASNSWHFFDGDIAPVNGSDKLSSMTYTHRYYNATANLEYAHGIVMKYGPDVHDYIKFHPTSGTITGNVYLYKYRLTV